MIIKLVTTTLKWTFIFCCSLILGQTLKWNGRTLSSYAERAVQTLHLGSWQNTFNNYQNEYTSQSILTVDGLKNWANQISQSLSFSGNGEKIADSEKRKLNRLIEDINKSN